MIFEPRCSICKEIKKEMIKDGSSKLERRLNHCKKFNPGGESQKIICKDYNFNPISMSKHLKFHQNPDTNVVVEERMNRTADRFNHQNIRNKLAEKGLEALESGEVKVTPGVLARVAKDQADIELKEKDQQLKVLEMIAAYASGELIPQTTDSDR